jgi:hypothetical protein
VSGSIWVEQLLYLNINVNEQTPLLVNLFGKIKAFKGFYALPDELAGVVRDGVVPND